MVVVALQSFPSECLLERERLLRSRVDELGRERTERFARLARLKERDQTLADQLYATPHYVAGGGAGVVPTVEALDTLGKHVESLEAEKVSRAAQRPRAGLWGFEGARGYQTLNGV